MKLVLFIVSAMTIFPADSRDFPDKPDEGSFSVGQDEYFSSNLVGSDFMEERKGKKEMRHKGIQRCKFPFIYGGKTYWTCTEANYKGKPWCSTETDYWNNYIGEWKLCSGSDLKKFQVGCKFPFIYKGNTYNTCTDFDWNQPWCSTTTDDKHNYNGNWKNC